MTTALARYERPLEMAVASIEDFRTLLMANAPMIGEASPRWSPVTPEQVIQTAIVQVDRSPNQSDLLRCTGRSILQSVRDAVELGLSFTPALGQAYLVPFKGKCTLMLGYRGLADLVRRAADVTVLDSGVVYQGELFEAVKGDRPTFKHVQRLDVDRSDAKVVGAYAIAHYPNGMVQFEVLNLGELKKVRQVSRMSSHGPWQDWFSEMCRKTAIRRLAKLLPISAEKAKLVELTFAHEDRFAGASPVLTPADRTRLALAPAQDSTPGEKKVMGAATRLETPAVSSPPAASGGGPATATPPSAPTPSAARQRLYDLLRAIAQHRNTTLDDEWAKLRKAAKLPDARTIWTLKEEGAETMCEIWPCVKMAERVVKKEGADAGPFLPGGPNHQPMQDREPASD